MSTPRHRAHAGTTYFVTTKCHQSRAIFQIPEVAQTLVHTLFHYRDRDAYLPHEFVVMPDHLHLLFTPGKTTSLEKAISMIKGGSSHRIHKERGHKMEVWQEGFHDWTIRDANDWRAKAEYIRMNPVRAKLVEKAEDWPYSSGRTGFILDAVPPKYSQLSSGAKAPFSPALAPGLKPRPPREQSNTAERSTISYGWPRPSKGPYG